MVKEIFVLTILSVSFTGYVRAAAPSFSLVALPSLPNARDCSPKGISRDIAIGYCAAEGTVGPGHAVVWVSGQVHELLAVGYSSIAVAVNSKGEIAGGIADATAANQFYAVIWKSFGGAASPLPGLKDKYGNALAINARESVVGSSSTTGQVHPILWKAGAASDLQGLGGTYSEARAINDAGVIVGVSTFAPPANSIQHATIWKPGSGPAPLATLAPDPSLVAVPSAINKSGVITGYAQDSSGNAHGVTWKGGVISKLPIFAGGGASSGLAINTAGHIVGDATVGNKAVASLWIDGEGWDLNTLVEDSSPIKPFTYLAQARGINDSDTIVVLGWDMRFNSTKPKFQSAYLLTRIKP